MSSGCLIRQLVPQERPRERLLEWGGKSLTDVELLAVLLRTGCPGVSVVELARGLLLEVGSLAALRDATCETLRRRGLGAAKAATLLAAVEVGRRMAKAEVPERQLMEHPAEVARYLILRYGRFDQEMLGAMFLDTRNRLIRDREFFRGTLHRAAVEPRAVLKEGLLCNAANFLLFHTHPSGDPSPSGEDFTFTRRMAQAGELVGIHLLDHMVLGGAGRWVSLRDRGAW